MDESSRRGLYVATVAENPWIKHTPHPRQAEFLMAADVMEVFYGGAASGGKSDALLMAALQFVEAAEYRAILLRKTIPALKLSGGLLDRAHSWIGEQAKWSSDEKEFRFPSGAVLGFGHMETDSDMWRYQSSEYHFIGFDELTDFTETQYLFMFGRKRRLKSSQIPNRVRSASNPLGPGKAWVKRRFVSKEAQAADKETLFSRTWPNQGRLFVPARFTDNPSIDREDYDRSLSEMPASLRIPMREGDWRELRGGLFDPSEWPLYADLGDAYSVPGGTGRTIYHKSQVVVFITVDWATSEKKSADRTCFGVWGLLPDGRLLVLEVVAERWPLERLTSELAKVCRKWCPAMVAAETGGFQTALAVECRRHAEIPEVRWLRHEGKAKLQRALPAVTMGENGRILMPDRFAAWAEDFTEELAAFSGQDDGHDDRVDVTAYAAQQANMLRGPQSRGTGRDPGPAVLTPGYSPPFLA